MVKGGTGSAEALAAPARAALEPIRTRVYATIAKPGVPRKRVGVVINLATRSVAEGGGVVD
jgi:hypothetical protein